MDYGLHFYPKHIWYTYSCLHCSCEIETISKGADVCDVCEDKIFWENELNRGEPE